MSFPTKLKGTQIFLMGYTSSSYFLPHTAMSYYSMQCGTYLSVII